MKKEKGDVAKASVCVCVCVCVYCFLGDDKLQKKILQFRVSQ